MNEDPSIAPPFSFVPTRPAVDASLLVPTGQRPAGNSARQVSFAEVLGKAHGPGLDGRSVEERAHAGAEQLVAVSLVQPLFKQLRDLSQAAPPFAPTSAEKQLRALQDAEVARQVVRAGRFPLVERLARQMLDRASGALPDDTAGAPRDSQ